MDPPALVEIWQAQPRSRGLTQPISVSVLEHFVFSKPYFDRDGLIVAEDDGTAVGFVHAGFGPNSQLSDISRELGVICMLQVAPGYESTELPLELLAGAEDYLRISGAQKLVGGAHPPYMPFYHGLCGSGELPGVLATDVTSHQAYQTAGYACMAEFAVLDCDLRRARPLVDRNQRQLARSFQVRPTMDHMFDNWWETCAFGPIQRSQFELISTVDNMPCGSMLWWDLESPHSLSRPGVALSRLEIVDNRRRTGLATFLVSSALKQLKSSGAVLAQVQVPTSNQPGLEFFRKLGFVDVARGVAYQKVLQPGNGSPGG